MEPWTSCTFFWGKCTFQVSNIIVELRKLIQKIIQTRFLCWRSNFKNSCFGFHQVSKRSKTIKPLGLRPRGFKCFSRLETRWNTRTRFWNITSRMADLGSSVSYVPIKSKLQHPPPGNPPGIWIFGKFWFKFPPPEAEKLFKCPIIGPFQVIKCPHPRENFQ